MSAPVTEAHRELAYAILFATEDGHAGPNETAQLIADSEAKATAELRGALAFGQQNCDDVYDDLRTERDAAIARAERAEAELAKERARLDWLEKSGPWESWNGFGETGITLRKNARAAIDAAMKEDAK